MGTTVSTVEHLLSAACALGVDNARVEVDGPELPAMDGSAAPFVYLLSSAGLYAQRAPRKIMRVTRTLSLSEGERYLCSLRAASGP